MKIHISKDYPIGSPTLFKIYLNCLNFLLYEKKISLTMRVWYIKDRIIMLSTELLALPPFFPV